MLIIPFNKINRRNSYQPNPSGKQVVHHALFELAGFGELGFEGGDFGIHVGEDGGDGCLFWFLFWQCDFKSCQLRLTDFQKSASSAEADKTLLFCLQQVIEEINVSCLLASLKSGISDSLLALASGPMIFLLIWSPMSGLPLSAIMSLKLAPSGIVIGAYGTPAYLSLTYLKNSNTNTSSWYG